MHFQLPQLPYSFDALEPHISARTLEFHYGKHHRKYVEKTNKLLSAPTAWQEDLTLEDVVKTSTGELFNNAAQAWNHTFFWLCLGSDGDQTDLPSPLTDAINRDFGSFEKFKEQFTKKATELFGSGWVWLVKNKDEQLSIVSTKDGDTPITDELIPCLTLDVWEHAYYLDYQNERPKFIENFWPIVNWEFVAENFAGESIPNMTRLMLGTGGEIKRDAPTAQAGTNTDRARSDLH